MDNTIIQQGFFSSTGTSMTLPIRSGIDWMEVIDYTQFIAQPAGGNATGVKFYWANNMPVTGLAYVKNGASDALTGVIGVANSFNLVDSSASMLGTPIAVTAGANTNTTQPIYTTGNTNGLVTGNIIRIFSTAQTNVNGMDFSVGTVVNNTSFQMAATLQQAPGVASGANGFWQFVAPDLATYRLFYPSKRTIINITQAASAVVTTSVAHGYTVGQMIRLNVPAVCGMTQMNLLLGQITAVTTYTFTVNINSSSFTAFTFPTYLVPPCSFANAVPVGETAGGALDDATYNQGYIGMILGGGLAAVGAAANGPAGINGDIMYWKAGKSFNL